MAEFLQALDPSKLVLVETFLSFVTCAFAAPSYNLPIFLFGIYAQESAEAVQSLKSFTLLLAGSIVLDIIWMARNHQNWFIRTVTILTQILKVPTVLAFGAALRQRGAQFSGIGFRGNDLSGATVWSMPGGFTSFGTGGREGYQNVDDETDVPTAKPPGPTPGLGSSNNQTAPGAYQSV
ncbi:hypothetical protein PHLCEN_2v433 [Hermanssonia centrifuga]|uniref:Uncharacterized protein n=1 Tax=Hermanssonia centrifuga TaxID=98765 RepID=A0A2R6S607_9APHY|nr:hypothetical protein PHLCEN_2v433 [Hermanssonia centrifuga]